MNYLILWLSHLWVSFFSYVYIKRLYLSVNTFTADDVQSTYRRRWAQTKQNHFTCHRYSEVSSALCSCWEAAPWTCVKKLHLSSTSQSSSLFFVFGTCLLLIISFARLIVVGVLLVCVHSWHFVIKQFEVFIYLHYCVHYIQYYSIVNYSILQQILIIYIFVHKIYVFHSLYQVCISNTVLILSVLKDVNVSKYWP